MNQDSSRSHSVFTITIETLEQGPGTVGCPIAHNRWPHTQREHHIQEQGIAVSRAEKPNQMSMLSYKNVKQCYLTDDPKDAYRRNFTAFHHTIVHNSRCVRNEIISSQTQCILFAPPAVCAKVSIHLLTFAGRAHQGGQAEPGGPGR
jgi:hypothetical protein